MRKILIIADNDIHLNYIVGILEGIFVPYEAYREMPIDASMYGAVISYKCDIDPPSGIPYIYIGNNEVQKADITLDIDFREEDLIDALMGAISPEDDPNIYLLGCTLDPASRTITFPNRKRAILTKLEMGILTLLYSSKGRVITKDEMAYKLRNKGKEPTADSLRVTISKLNGKFFDNGYLSPIKSTFGKGYSLNDELKARERKNSDVYAVIPLSGMSKRMGKFKPLLPFKGKTVIETLLDTLLNGGVNRVIVVTGHKDNDVNRTTNKYGDKVISLFNKRYRKCDMLYSIKEGVKKVPEGSMVLILPGDMPMIRSSTVQNIIRESHKNSDKITIPMYNREEGHPICIPYGFISDLLLYSGEKGLRGFLESNRRYLNPLSVDDEGILKDLDTPEDYKEAIKAEVDQ